MKIYVIEEFKGKNPTLINNKRVAEILLDKIENKGINIVTLVPENKKLDDYWIQHKFKHFPDENIKKTYAEVANLNYNDEEYFMYKILKIV